MTPIQQSLHLQKWPLNPNLLVGKKHRGLAPWCLFNISKWEWNSINNWLSIHGYCGQLTKLKTSSECDILVGEVFGTECVLWIDPAWQAACIAHIDSLPERVYTVYLKDKPTRKQANALFQGNYEIFTGYDYCFGSFADEQDAFLATMGWKS